jgi:hypothetical protein
MDAKTKKLIVSVVSLALVILPIASAARRAYVLKYSGDGQYDNQSYLSVFLNLIIQKYS